MVQVERIDETTFKVTVEADTTTTHTVTVEHLVERSFDFLLERESNRSILASFDLSVIQRYFPEYERTIGGMLGEG